MIDVKSARYVEGYKVWIEFSNEESGVVDLEPDLRGPMFEPLKDPEKFKKFRVSGILRTLIWDNGANFAPEYLYSKIATQSFKSTV